MLEQARIALVNYILRQLSLPEHEPTTFDLSPYLEQLPRGDGHIHNIFDTFTARKPYYPDAKLSQNLTHFRQNAFGRGINPLQTSKNSPSPSTHFESWAALIEAATVAQRGGRGEPGVSLYHEFKLVSALVHATGADSALLSAGFTLVGGDFPGIQRVIYTITSDGATKGVRGRSFFLQLLTECIVRRILGEYHLPISNALYIAGGRFLLLLPPAIDLSHIVARVNSQLLTLFEGDLSFTLATSHLPSAGIADDTIVSDVLKQMKEEEGRQKLQPFIQVEAAQLFGEYGKGSKYFCAISRREPRDDRELTQAKQAEQEQKSWICDEQRAFQRLAEELAKVHPIGSQPGNPSYLVFSPTVPEGYETDLYPSLLKQISDYCCVVTASDAQRDAIMQQQPSAPVVSLNHTGSWGRAEGFRYFALYTPHTSKQDINWWYTKYGTDDEIREGVIRNFELLATRGSNTSFARYGVLRMDVDSLGDYFSGQLFDAPTLTRRMTLSSAISQFFEVYVPQICQEAENKFRPHDGSSLYLIYGGGDDLFVVGEWDLLPLLAQRIHHYLNEFGKGRLTISAGIEIVPAKFPFYLVATLAKQALDDQAKAYNPDHLPQPRKDAISMLGETFGWEDERDTWYILSDFKDTLKTLYQNSQQMTVIRNVALIHERWRADFVRYGATHVAFGPFHWLTAYRMSQIKRSLKDDDDKERVTHLQQDLLTPNGVRIAGVAARWAEFEIRTHREGER